MTFLRKLSRSCSPPFAAATTLCAHARIVTAAAHCAPKNVLFPTWTASPKSDAQFLLPYFLLFPSSHRGRTPVQSPLIPSPRIS